MIHYAEAVVRMAAPPPPKLVQVGDCCHGTMMYFPHDVYIGGALQRYGEYIEAELDLLLTYVKEGDVVVEVGANMGCDTVPLAKAVGNAGRVLAFEPQRIIYQMLCGNLAINGIWNVIAERAALGATPGVMYVPPVDYAQTGNFGGVPLQTDGGEPAQVLRLDDYHLGRCDLIKIDVEGMEKDVLEGARDTIARLRPLLYVENDRQEKAQALVECLRGMDYDLYWHLPKMFNPKNYRNNPVNDYKTPDGVDLVSMNMLCLPHEKQMACDLSPVRLAK